MSLWLLRARRKANWRKYVLRSLRRVKLNRLRKYIGQGYEVLPRVIELRKP